MVEMDNYRYQDEDGFWIEIGTIVGFLENLTDRQINPQDPTECYKIVGLPNMGDTIRMVAGHYVAGETEGSGQFVPMWGDGDEEADFTLIVTPWMIGAI